MCASNPAGANSGVSRLLQKFFDYPSGKSGTEIAILILSCYPTTGKKRDPRCLKYKNKVNDNLTRHDTAQKN